MSEPTQRRTDDNGGKYYEHPVRTEDVPDPSGVGTIVQPRRYDSVTTALGIIDKDALKFWAANLAARRAMENLPKLIGAARIETCGRARARVEPFGCGTCVDCVQAWVALFHHGETERRAREGSAAHDVLEWWTKTGVWRYQPRADWGEYAPTDEQMAPYIRRLQEFVADYALTPESWLVCECTVYNHTHGYAGTLDGVVQIFPVTRKAADFCARVALAAGYTELNWAQMLDNGVRVIIDLKSREGEGPELYREQPLQQTGYRFAETMMPKLGLIEMPMLSTDGAAILQVRPDGYTLRPVITDGRTMKAFLATLDLYRWSSGYGDFSTQVKAFPRPEDYKLPTWERATLADGTLCPCIGCDDPADGRCLAQADAVRPMGKHTKTPKPAPTGPQDAPTVAPVKAAPRKRAAAKKAAAPAARQPSATIESLQGRMVETGARRTIPDSEIPF